MFLLTGGVSLDNPHPNPCGDWLAPKQWNEICLLSDVPAFAGLRDNFEPLKKQWKAVYDASAPQDSALPGPWEKLQGLRRLCVLRCIHGKLFRVTPAKTFANARLHLLQCLQQQQRVGA